MMKTKAGIVYLIGAGPGDPGLISCKGKALLEQCDTVVYDALVNSLLVDGLPSHVKLVFAGKRGGKPSMPQDVINRILVREARKGRNVARLKGGDPLLFGRGSEEMEFLRAAGIAYEIVPGVTSAIAAPAWAGIPVTHRSVSRSVAFVTGHLKKGDDLMQLQIPRADTITFLMAVENLESIVDAVLGDGIFTKGTPAALIQDGTLPTQKTAFGTLGTIAALRRSRGIEPPAVLVVGKVVSLAESLAWFKRPPLAGTRAVVLRASEQSSDVVKLLSDKGATVVLCPVIEIRPRATSLARIGRNFCAPFTSVVFTSPNAASLFCRALLDKGLDARILAGKKVYAIGTGTADALRRFGIAPDAVPGRFVAEDLLTTFPRNLRGKNILIPRASNARAILPETLRRRGAEVTVLPLYDTVRIETSACPVQNGDFVLFTSSSTVESYFADRRRAALRIVPCCLGTITAATLRRFYKGRIFVSPAATMKSLVDTVIRASRAARTERITHRTKSRKAVG